MPRIVGYLNVQDRLSLEEYAESFGAGHAHHRNQTDACAHDDKLLALTRKNVELEGKIHSKEQEMEQVFDSFFLSKIYFCNVNQASPTR